MLDIALRSSPDFATPMEWALHLRDVGFTIIPTFPNSKIPVEKWERWEDDQSEEHVRTHWRRYPAHEVGVITNKNLIVFDADSPEAIAALDALEAKHSLSASLIVDTRKGQHRYYFRPDEVIARQNAHSTEKHPERVDVKTDHSLVMGPGSKNKIVRKWDFTVIAELNPVTQAFVADVFEHNQATLQTAPSTLPAVTRTALEDPEGLAKVKDLLDAIEPEDYGVWLQCGMAVFHESGGSDEGLALFDEWSSRGSTYKGLAESELKWRSFESGYAVTMGTLVHLAKQAGADVAAILRGSDDAFVLCDYEVVGSVHPATEVAGKESTEPSLSTLEPEAMEGHQLRKYSLRDRLPEVEAQAVQQKLILGGLMIYGQVGVIYAKPNTGKTVITLRLIVDDVRSGLIDPSILFYLNMDDNSAGLVEKLQLAQEFGFHMLADGQSGFEARMLKTAMADMIATNTARGVIVVLDTLTKFVDTMSKTESRIFTRLMRQFSLRGGTVLALAHTNKHLSASGKPVYAGTADIVNDFDCAYTLETLSESADDGQRVVEFNNFKRRGDVVMTVAYSYAMERLISYSELLSSVQVVDPTQSASLKGAAEIRSDAEVISAIEVCIGDGINTKMKLMAAAAKAASVSQRIVLKVIDKYTGNDPSTCRWFFKVGERGAKFYELLESRTRPSDARAISPPDPITDTGS